MSRNARRPNIYLSEALKAVLYGRTSDARGRSATITTIAERYHETCRRHTPPFALGQWSALLGVCSGWWSADGASPVHLASEVENTVRLTELAKRHEISGTELVARVKRLSYAERCAVLDVCERYWMLPDRGDNTRAALDALGVGVAKG